MTLLRDHCLHCLAARFEALAEEHAPQREREVFEAFVAAVAPQVPQPWSCCLPLGLPRNKQLLTILP